MKCKKPVFVLFDYMKVRNAADDRVKRLQTLWERDARLAVTDIPARPCKPLERRYALLLPTHAFLPSGYLLPPAESWCDKLAAQVAAHVTEDLLSQFRGIIVIGHHVLAAISPHVPFADAGRIRTLHRLDDEGYWGAAGAVHNHAAEMAEWLNEGRC